jgi:CubicO group peptidase (beta-lactamase class C family)
MRLPALIAALGLAATTSLSAQRSDRGAIITQIDSVVQAEMASSKTPAMSVAVSRKGEVILAKGYGLANVELSVPATANTVYRTGSITKQFTAALIMQLVEAGKIGLDDPITKFLPDYPTQGHTVTIHHLLTHLSGIKSYTSLGPKFWTEASRLDLSDSAMMASFKNLPFDFAPGAKYQYNNSAYYLLGVIIEKVTGTSYRNTINEKLAPSLGLQGTSYCDESTIIPHRAQGYEFRNGKLQNDDPISMNTPGAAGAICSTVLDLLSWREALFGGRVVSNASLAKMTTPATLNDGKPTGYGYGLSVGPLEGHRSVGHGGGINGFITYLAYYPDDDVTVAVLGNLGSAPSNRVATMVARLVLGIGLPVVKDLPIAADERRRVSGNYDAGGGTITVREEGETLILTGGPGGPQRLKGQGDGRYVPEKQPDWVIRFTPATGQVAELVVTASGATFSAKRKS